jgi:CBS domain-containing protein
MRRREYPRPDVASVRDVMSTGLVTVDPTATVAHAATVMGEHHCGSALVMEGGKLVGIFTERDILRALSQDFDAPGHSITHWMTRDPVTVPADMPIDDALQLMLTRKFRHLPVYEGGAVLGVVSMRDLSQALGEDVEREPS